MKEYEEFRIQISTNPADERWSVDLRDCPIPGEVGPKGAAHPVMTRQQLDRLRRREDWPNSGLLTEIGTSVWQSVMTPGLGSALNSCLNRTSDNKGLRITFFLDDRGEAQPEAPVIRLAELPVEALYEANHGFLAASTRTPIGRSLQIEPDTEPTSITLPLRILLVVAAPVDKPPVQADDEVSALREALASLLAEGAVELELCEPPTKEELLARLSRSDEPCHVLHFVGHGGFNVTGADPTPQGYMALERSDGTKRSDPLYANDFSTFLRDSEVRLAVLTACSTAAPASADEPYATGALAGVAQRLVANTSNLAAAVAMQFDLETTAATEFTREFYRRLLDEGRSLDETVARARKAIIARLNQGHRAWLTPTVYNRCLHGVVFTFANKVEPTDNGGLRVLIADTRDEITQFVDYKTIHDILHELQINCLNQIINDQDLSNNLGYYVETFKTKMIDLWDTVNHPSSRAKSEISWVQRLDEAMQTMDAAWSDSEKDKLNKAIGIMKPILSQKPTHVNGVVFNTAGRFPGLVSGLSQFYQRDSVLAQAPGANEMLVSVVNDLSDLEPSLKALVIKHNSWQEIDDESRYYEDDPVDKLSIDNWEYLKSKLEQLCTGKEDRLNGNFEQLSEKLESAIRSANAAEIRSTFSQCRHTIILKFFRVDRDLKSNCKRLQDDADKLDLLLNLLPG